MSEWIGVVLFVIAILLVVVIHEGGHFSLAKLFGIKVEEFFVGFGPRIWSTRTGFFQSGRHLFKRRRKRPPSETEYGLKALLFGGYVRIAGMNPLQEPSPDEYPRTFAAKPIWQRALVIAAGPLTHFVMAVVVLAIYFAAIGAPSEARPLIEAVQPTLSGQTSPAVLAGLQAGDEVVALGGQPVGSADRFISYTRAHVGQTISVTVLRDGQRVTVRATPILSKISGDKEPVGRLGVRVGFARGRTDPFTAFGRGVIQTGVTTKGVVLQLGHVFGPAALKRVGQLLIGSAERRSTDPTSIIGAARVAGQAVEQGLWDQFIVLLVVFNIFVGILNLVPLPPFDGGHLAVLAYEKVRRRKPDVRKLVPVTAVVAAFVILFALAVSYLDIVKPLPSPFR